MANTYTQLYVHLVFVVSERQCLIREDFRQDMQKYINGIVNKMGHKLLAIYCMPDHTHILLGLQPELSISETAGKIKSNISKWINNKNLIPGKFTWQSGYGAFTYGISQVDNIIEYIRRQPEKHKVKSFREEYIKILERFQIDYDNNYIFKDVL